MDDEWMGKVERRLTRGKKAEASLQLFGIRLALPELPNKMLDAISISISDQQPNMFQCKKKMPPTLFWTCFCFMAALQWSWDRPLAGVGDFSWNHGGH